MSDTDLMKTVVRACNRAKECGEPVVVAKDTSDDPITPYCFWRRARLQPGQTDALGVVTWDNPSGTFLFHD